MQSEPGVRGMNGTQPQGQTTTVPVMDANTPVMYYQPIAITPATIKWIAGAVVAALALMPSGFLDRYMLPAKDSEVQALTAIVKVLQQGQQDTSDAVKRLTLAVDNLSGLVDRMQTLKNAAPKLKTR